MAVIKQKHFVLIRGLTREAAHWGPFPTYLKEAFPGCEVTTLDLPGAGIHYKTVCPLTPDRIVEQIHRDFLPGQLPTTNNILIAKSLGAMVAVHWMKKQPALFQKAVLINTSFSDCAPFYQRLRPKAAFDLSRGYLIRDPAKREEAILKVVLNHPQNFQANLKVAELVARTRPVSVANAIRQLIAATRFELKQKPLLPMLILASTHDRMVDVACSRTLARKWEIPIIEHPTAGHELSDDDPHWVKQKIRAFIEEE